jgi:mannose-6-phosphate isomerase-like protein (cupin superfamily)
MSKTNLLQLASSLPASWKSKIVGAAAGANFKVLRMDDAEYPRETHVFDEALLVLNGRMNLRFGEEIVQINSGEVYIVPAGIAHAVAAGSYGTLIIIDQSD